jgi:hypothetical protein
MARITKRPEAQNTEGDAYVTSEVSSLQYSVYDITDPAAPAGVSSHTGQSLSPVSSYWFDTLQGWHVDTIGHNLRFTLPPAAFPTGGKVYAVQVKITFSDSTVGHVTWQAPAEEVWHS